MVVVYLLYSIHAATVFDAIQKRGCHAATRTGTVAPTVAASRVGSVITHRESATVRGRAGAGVSILPPEYDFVALREDEEEGGGGAGDKAMEAPAAAAR
jgi:hypothetical protein